MIHSTKGIVLRSIKYGETSLVVNIFTELFGIQAYMVNGVRTQGKNVKAHLFQPASILDLQVYHSELKNLQRIKEVKWNHIYKNILSNVTRNAVALYMVELLQKCLKQPENNHKLFEFVEDAFLALDIAEDTITANFPIYFSLHLAKFFGLSIEDSYSSALPVLDLQEGKFISQPPHHQHFVEGDQSYYISQLIKTMHPDELAHMKINKSLRREILSAFQDFYALHMPEFGKMKTLPVLQELLM